MGYAQREMKKEEGREREKKENLHAFHNAEWPAERARVTFREQRLTICIVRRPRLITHRRDFLYKDQV